MSAAPASYRCMAFHPSLPEGQSAGQISFSDGAFRFAGDAGEAVGAIDKLGVEIGGHNRSQIFLTHPECPNWKWIVSDTALLRDPALSNHPALGGVVRQAERKRRKWPWPLKVAVAVLLLFLAGCVYGIVQLEKLVRAASTKVPASVEKSFGDAVASQIKSTSKILTDHPTAQKMLDAATARLLPTVKSSGYEFTFYIVDDASMNAFAVPGGHIFIHTGLIEKCERPEQLAGVLSHEIAHITERHSLRNILKNAGLATVVSILLGGTDLGGSTVTDASQWLLEQKFSRDFEREADEVGFRRMVEAKIDPKAMLEFFVKLKEAEGAQAGLPAAWMSTHPATEERLNRLKTLESQVPLDFKPEPINLAP